MFSPFYTSAFQKSGTQPKTSSEFPCYTGMPVSLVEFGRCYCLRFDGWFDGQMGRWHPKDSAGMTQGWGVLVLKMTPVFEGVRILGVWYICSPTFGSWGVTVFVDTPNTWGPLVVNIPYIESLGFSNVQNPYLTFPLCRISAPILCTANNQGHTDHCSH